MRSRIRLLCGGHDCCRHYIAARTSTTSTIATITATITAQTTTPTAAPMERWGDDSLWKMGYHPGALGWQLGGWKRG